MSRQLTLHPLVLARTVVSSFTQTPLLYSVRVMGCKTWWEEHPDYDWDGVGDRCSIEPILSLTARK